jgi:hypothetical protein
MPVSLDHNFSIFLPSRPNSVFSAAAAMQALHQQYTEIAQTYMPQFVAKKGEERTALVATVVAEITAHSAKEGLALPPNLATVRLVASLLLILMISVLQKVQNWFNNHRPRDDTKKKTKSDKDGLVNWQVRNVVQQTKKDAILQRMAANVPGITRKDDAWISTYQKACTDVITDLTAEETRECEDLAKEWNETGPDPATQAM